MSIDIEGLHEVANTGSRERGVDIVFVHGLGGSSHATWRYGKEGKPGHFFWPEELGRDLTECGVWTVGYPAGFTALGTPGMIIEKRAGNLAQRLANAGVGERPIIFITHSMGGLIAKSLVVGSQVLADPDRKRIADATAGIVFCATPHRGSDFANAASILGVAFGGSQAHVDEMRDGREQLDILHDQFVEWQRTRGTPVCSYAENIGLFRKRLLFRPIPLGLVVPRASANPNIAGHTVRDVDDDHLSLVKPRNRKHDVYAGTLRFIQEVLGRPVARGGVVVVSKDELARLCGGLSKTQKGILGRVAQYDDGVHVMDLAEDLDMKRAEVVYRARDLQALGLVKIESLTDLCISLSVDVKRLRDQDRASFSRLLLV